MLFLSVIVSLLLEITIAVWILVQSLLSCWPPLARGLGPNHLEGVLEQEDGVEDGEGGQTQVDPKEGDVAKDSPLLLPPICKRSGPKP